VNLDADLALATDEWLDLFPLLGEIEKIAKKYGHRLGFVGGAVRDLILGVKLRKDFDLLYTGDIEELRALLKERYQIHLRKAYFNMTLWAPRLRLDIGLPRRDRYPVPGGIPSIEPASLQEDLHRRDFTWNALYLELTPERGMLIDLFSGIEDLKNGQIRPIHPHTLLEDPIRILRGMRYQARFSFERQGEGWDQALTLARNPSFFITVAKGRIWQEMKRLAEEEKSLSAYRLLMESGADRGVFHFPLTERDLQLFETLRKNLKKNSLSVFYGDLTLLYHLHPSLEETISRWSPPSQERRSLKLLIEEVKKAVPSSPFARTIKEILKEEPSR
jgi:tRNA nucleotidyltransferase (CCA-adding enzyme)